MAMLFKVVFLLLALISSSFAFSSVRNVRMSLDPVLSKSFPRDFKNIPVGTDYGKDKDHVLNVGVEKRRLDYLENDLYSVLKEAVASR